MNHLIADPSTFMFIPIRNYNFTFLDCYKEYCHIQSLYDYMNYIDEHSIKNVYQQILIRWSLLSNIIQQESKLQCYSHGIMDSETFNKLILDFSKDDKVKCIFIINSIIHYINPVNIL